MTTRVKGFIVTLAEDIREDEMEAHMTALRMVHGVTDVRPVEAGYEDVMVRLRVDSEWRARLYDLIGTVR